jgi:hypothetical protein
MSSPPHGKKRANPGDAVRRGASEGLTRNGVSKAVIISSEEHEGLMETLDILSCKAEREAIARAKKQVKKVKRFLWKASRRRRYEHFY